MTNQFEQSKVFKSKMNTYSVRKFEYGSSFRVVYQKVTNDINYSSCDDRADEVYPTEKGANDRWAELLAFAEMLCETEKNNQPAEIVLMSNVNPQFSVIADTLLSENYQLTTKLNFGELGKVNISVIGSFDAKTLESAKSFLKGVIATLSALEDSKLNS